MFKGQIDINVFLGMLVLAGTIIGGLWAWFNNRSKNSEDSLPSQNRKRLEEVEMEVRELKDEFRIYKRKVNKIIERLIERSSF